MAKAVCVLLPNNSEVKGVIHFEQVSCKCGGQVNVYVIACLILPPSRSGPGDQVWLKFKLDKKL